MQGRKNRNRPNLVTVMLKSRSVHHELFPSGLVVQSLEQWSIKSEGSGFDSRSRSLARKWKTTRSKEINI